VNTHDAAFCAYTGGNYEGKFPEARKAAKAAKEAEQAIKVRLAGQPTELERAVDSLKDGLLQQSQIISDAEKRIGSVVKRMEKLERRVQELEWDNHLLREESRGESWKFWKCNNELRAWENWYNNSFEQGLDSWVFSSFSFTQQGSLYIGASEALARYRRTTGSSCG
jgi:hypothetical protein